MAFRGRGPRSRFIPPPPPDAHRINRRIRAPQVRLILPDGSQAGEAGIVPLEEAMRYAEDAGLDLVEVASNANPPVCRILDYGKFKYQQHKKEAESKKKQATTTLKELRLGYKTDVGDLTRQIQKARKFLEEGDRVKFTLRFRGREMAYQNLGREKLMKVREALSDLAALEGTPRMEGRLMGMVLAPLKKKLPGEGGGKPAKAAKSKKSQPDSPPPAAGSSAPSAS